jgi:multidrug resistance protein MdtO
MAFAFYLINVTDFSISLDLTIGRDRAVGVLLGIGAMWLVFERLYSRPAGIEMVVGFTRATRLVAELTSVQEHKVGSAELDRIHSIRAAASGLFTSVNAEADAVPFERGHKRWVYLAARNRIRRWLSTLRTIYLLELPLLQTGIGGDPEQLSSKHREVDKRFYQALSEALDRIANCLEIQLQAVTHDHSGREIISDSLGTLSCSRSLTALVKEDDVSPSLRVLATIVDELECDVSSEPMFAV